MCMHLVRILGSNAAGSLCCWLPRPPLRLLPQAGPWRRSLLLRMATQRRASHARSPPQRITRRAGRSVTTTSRRCRCHRPPAGTVPNGRAACRRNVPRDARPCVCTSAVHRARRPAARSGLCADGRATSPPASRTLAGTPCDGRDSNRGQPTPPRTARRGHRAAAAHVLRPRGCDAMPPPKQGDRFRSAQRAGPPRATYATPTLYRIRRKTRRADPDAPTPTHRPPGATRGPTESQRRSSWGASGGVASPHACRPPTPTTSAAAPRHQPADPSTDRFALRDGRPHRSDSEHALVVSPCALDGDGQRHPAHLASGLPRQVLLQEVRGTHPVLGRAAARHSATHAAWASASPDGLSGGRLSL